MPIQKSSAQNNGWTKKEAKIFKRNSMISRLYNISPVVILTEVFDRTVLSKILYPFPQNS